MAAPPHRMTIAVRTWGAGSPVVLIHGASGSWNHWVRNIDALAEHHRVLAVDLPGYGESELTPDIHDIHDVAAALVGALDNALGPTVRFDLVAFSFGGLVGTLSARMLGDRVGRLVLIGTGGIGMAGRVPDRPAGARPADEGERQRQDLARFMFSSIDAVTDEALTLHLENLANARFESGNLPGSTLTSKALPFVDAELHALYSDADAYSGGNPAEPFSRLRAVRPDVHCRVITGAGHWSPYETPDQINAAILDILSRPSVAIRPATATDRPAVERIVEAAYEGYVEAMGQKPAPMLDDYAVLIDRGVVHVAEGGGELVGLIVLWPEPDHLHVDNIAVDPATQGSGIGGRLLRAADLAARAAGLDEIRLYTHESMTANLGYYPSHGFTETHRAVENSYDRVYFSRSVPS
ncbi:MAG: alpha/beta fold hydrolase [Actinomycetia bacterium]|nr:alpha/beta fold hydrolase [Actinomycetes bacterium]